MPSSTTTSTSTILLPLSESSPLTQSEKEQLRQSAQMVFAQLEAASLRTQHESPTQIIPSWIRPDNNNSDNENSTTTTTTTDWKEQRSPTCHYFDMYGFCVQRNFCAPEEIASLKKEMQNLVDENWHPGDTDEDDDNDYAFATDAKSNTQRGDYFLDSADRVSYFAEPQALDDNGTLKDTYINNKMAALNKAGHGMHTLPGSAFFDYTFSDKLHQLVVHTLGWQHPVVPQSMYIFKQPSIGGTVHSHQDSTFLYTTPRQTCLGLWLALDDATLDNGCLWVRPQSHYETVRRQFLRNPEYFDNGKQSNDNNDKQKEGSCEDKNVPKLIFEERNPTPAAVTWEGGLPEYVKVLLNHDNDDDNDDDSNNNAEEESTPNNSSSNNNNSRLLFDSFVPVEVKAGDLVVFCGTLDHFSLPNCSKLPRHTFQLHLVEGPNAGVEWSPSNWLQYPKETPFLELSPS